MRFCVIISRRGPNFVLFRQKTLDKRREKELIERAKKDFQAFEELYDFYLPKIYAYIFRRIGNKQETEDITALTFEKALLGINKFRWQGISFSPWLYRIASNNVADYFRKAYKSKQVDLEKVKYSLKSNEDLTKDLENQEKADMTRKCLKEIPRQYQEVLTLKFYDELDNEEIVEILGCSKGNLAVKLYRSLKALKKVIAKNV